MIKSGNLQAPRCIPDIKVRKPTASRGEHQIVKTRNLQAPGWTAYIKVRKPRGSRVGT